MIRPHFFADGSVDGGGTDVVGASKIGDGFAVFPSAAGFLLLGRRHLRGSPHMVAAQFGAGAAFAGPCAD